MEVIYHLHRHGSGIYNTVIKLCQSQWLYGLRRGSATARTLRLRVLIPPGALMSICCEYSIVCCQVEVTATDRSLVQRSHTDCGVSLCCVLSGRGLYDGLITRPEESYRLWRVFVLCVVR